MATSIGRRLFIPLLASGLLLAASAGSALAKCEGANPPAFCSQVVAEMSVGGTTGTFTAGNLTPVEISLWLGEQPYQAQRVWLTFNRQADDTMLTFYATAAAQKGLWHADVTLPADGSWSVVANVVDAHGTAVPQPLEAVNVGAPRVDAQPQPPVTPTPPAPPSSPLLPIAVALAALAAAGVAAAGLRQRTRQRTAGGLAAVSGPAAPGPVERN